MIYRLNHSIVRFLKSFVLFSILLLGVSVLITEITASSLNVGILAVVVLQILLLSVSNLAPKGWARTLSKLGSIILGLGVFSLIILENYVNKIINASVFESTFINLILSAVIYGALYIVSTFSAFTSLETQLKAPIDFHRENLYLFKKRMLKLAIILGVLLGIGFIIDQFTDGTLCQTILLDTMFPLILIFLSSILLVRVSRDTIYLGVKSVAQQKMIIGYVVLGASTLGLTTLLIVFRNKLDQIWKLIVSAFSNLIDMIVRLWRNLMDYIARLTAQDNVPVSNEALKEILGDFGIDPEKLEKNSDDIVDPDGGLGGDPDDFSELGGIGAIGGMLGHKGGPGNIFDFAGELANVIMSESGKFGSAENGGRANSSIMATVKASTNAANIYLKLKSFGDYNGKGFSEAQEYTGTIADGIGMNYLTSYAYQKNYANDAVRVKLDIKSYTGQYFLPDYMALDNDIKYSNDVMMKGVTSLSYSVNCYYFSNIFENSVIYGDEAFRTTLSDYNTYVRKTYCQLPEETKEQALQFLSKYGITKDNENTVITQLRSVFRDYKYSMSYDRTLDDQDDVVISFLNGYSNNEGICQHFAGSSVVLLRALDIPARYVGGLHVGDLKADTWHSVTANGAHAWVEVYIRDTGWFRFDPTMYAQQSENAFKHVYTQDEYQQLIEEYNENYGEGGVPEILAPFLPGITPDNPSEPTNPDNPNEPNNPDNPSEPNNPDNPSEPTNPDNPSEPNDPDNPSEPDNPDDPSEPSNPDNSDSGQEELPNPNEQEKEEEEKEEITEDKKEPSDFEMPWLTVGIVAGSLVVATVFTTMLVYFLKKKKKPSKDKLKAVKAKAGAQSKDGVTEEESKTAKAIIRENYKQFIRVAGKNGIRKVKSDTTQSLRDKYNNLISPDEAMDILTGLYRNARYNKNEKLSMLDAETSQNCLQIIEDSIKNKTKQI